MTEKENLQVISVEDESLRIDIDGDWALREVQEYLRILQQLHGLTQVGVRLEKGEAVSDFAEHPWLGGYSYVNFYRWGVINARDSGKELQLDKFHYSSPGFFEIVEAAVAAKEKLGVSGDLASWGISLYIVGHAISAFASSTEKAVLTYKHVRKVLKNEDLAGKKLAAELAREEVALLKELDELLTSDSPIPISMEKAIEAATHGDLLHRVKARIGIRRRLHKLGKYQEEGRATPQPEQMKPKKGPRAAG